MLDRALGDIGVLVDLSYDDVLVTVYFGMNARAVILTDGVFWFIILIINMHTINVVFLLSETALNSLPFSWFRIGYFYLWTITYVIFQWICHACVKIWWPYPFMDLSSPYALLWYPEVVDVHDCRDRSTGG
ncbi:PREDICTED: uncharacterized protein LOC101297300 [Fragaria vesca subsp. vesca]